MGLAQPPFRPVAGSSAAPPARDLCIIAFMPLRSLSPCRETSARPLSRPRLRAGGCSFPSFLPAATFVAGIWSTGTYPSSLGFAKAGPRSGGGLCVNRSVRYWSGCRGDSFGRPLCRSYLVSYAIASAGDHKGRPYRSSEGLGTRLCKGLLRGGDGKLSSSTVSARGSGESGLATQAFSHPCEHALAGVADAAAD